jgi:hypothetical protein
VMLGRAGARSRRVPLERAVALRRHRARRAAPRRQCAQLAIDRSICCHSRRVAAPIRSLAIVEPSLNMRGPPVNASFYHAKFRLCDLRSRREIATSPRNFGASQDRSPRRTVCDLVEDQCASCAGAARGVRKRVKRIFARTARIDRVVSPPKKKHVNRTASSARSRVSAVSRVGGRAHDARRALAVHE